jgi:import inner membrane translocase subunit TIM23
MGALYGGASRLVSSVRSFESGDTTNLRLNRVLNKLDHAGWARGKRVGIIGLIYAGSWPLGIASMSAGDNLL